MENTSMAASNSSQEVSSDDENAAAAPRILDAIVINLWIK
jgi:hypothetical protein